VHAATAERPAATTPAPKYPNAVTRARIDTLLTKIEDAYFDYDKYSLRPDAMKALQADSTELRDILKDYLVGIGIPSTQLSLISYGKERPVCQEEDEACWQRNRRIHIVATAQAQK
jgi:peptidoglycan-associated lipoprotein